MNINQSSDSEKVENVKFELCLCLNVPLSFCSSPVWNGLCSILTLTISGWNLIIDLCITAAQTRQYKLKTFFYIFQNFCIHFVFKLLLLNCMRYDDDGYDDDDDVNQE